MINKEENVNEKEEKINLREMWKDKKGRAKIKLCLYGIFFIGVIIFTRVLGVKQEALENSRPINNSFLKEITDNYEYDIEINIDNDIYKYQGKQLGYNATITRTTAEETKEFSIINNKYYVNENGNYLLVTESEIYPYINYRYLDINNIKSYIDMSEKINNTYTLKLSNVLLNGSNDKYIIFLVDEETASLTIDYSELFKEINSNISKVIVKYKFNEINKIISLEDTNQIK